MEIWNGEKVLTEEDLIAPAFLQAWNDFLDCKYAVQIFSGGRGCVAAGTRLDTPYGKVRVEDFQGGLVYSYDGEKIIRAYAHKPIRYTEENLYRVKLSNGDSILVTDQHKFLTVAHGWRTTKQLARGDEIALASRAALDGASFPAVFRSYDEVIEEERNPNLARSDAFTYSRHDTLTTATVKDVYFECRDYYYDLFVPFYHNYVAEGIVNHNSTKSTFITLAILIGLDMYPNAHAVVYRKVASTLQGSVFNAFQKTINELLPGTEISRKWKFIKSPLMMRNVDTGQTIIFKGLDDPLKSKSISPPFGYYRFLFMEELAEYDGMAEVRSVRQSVLRGKGPFQSFYAYNPPETASEWVNYDLKKQLAVDPTLHLYHSTYRTVPIKWLGEDFFREAYFVSKVNERAYRHEYLGEITGTGGTIFPNVTLRKITDEEIDGFASLRWGADFGATDPNVLLGLNYESALKRILIFTESYGSMMLLDEIEADWRSKYFGHEYIYADSACKQMIMELQNRGFNMMGAVKGADSILHGISWLRNLWEIVIDPERCPNAAREFTHYEFLRLPDGSFSNKFPEVNNHTIDACRYSCEDLSSGAGII